MTNRRSPRNSASSTEWVIRMMVLPVSFQSFRMRPCIFSRVSASSAPSGSSIRMTVGIVGQAAGQRDALLHAAGELVDRLVAELLQSPTMRNRRCSDHRRVLSRRVAPFMARPEGDVVGHRHPFEQRALLEHHAAIGAGTGDLDMGAVGHDTAVAAGVAGDRRPLDPDAARGGARKPAMMLSRVVLPQPEGPRTVRISPRAMEKETCSSA